MKVIMENWRRFVGNVNENINEQDDRSPRMVDGVCCIPNPDGPESPGQDGCPTGYMSGSSGSCPQPIPHDDRYRDAAENPVPQGNNIPEGKKIGSASKYLA